MPFDRGLYPGNWREISIAIRNRAGWCCEECGAVNGEPHPETGSCVVLTVAHLDHDPQNCNPSNLRAWCQCCHLRYDAKLHAQHAAETRRQRQIAAGQMVMGGVWE